MEKSTIGKKNFRWASRCQFSEELFRETGAGGRCLQCRGNRDGPKCEVKACLPLIFSTFPPDFPNFSERFAWLATILDQEMGRPSLDLACSVAAIPREVSTTSATSRESARASQELLDQGLQSEYLFTGALVAMMRYCIGMQVYGHRVKIIAQNC